MFGVLVPHGAVGKRIAAGLVLADLQQEADLGVLGHQRAQPARRRAVRRIRHAREDAAGARQHVDRRIVARLAEFA